MIRVQLKEMKEKSGLTNKELSELSKVPLSTVSKIMSGQTDIPNFQTVCDLVKAMGGSLDTLAGIQHVDPPASNADIEMYIKLLKEKDCWLKRLFVICCALAIVLISVLIFDLISPTVGFIRR